MKKSKRQKTHPTMVYFSEEVHSFLRKMTKVNGHSVTKTVQELVNTYINRDR